MLGLGCHAAPIVWEKGLNSMMGHEYEVGGFFVIGDKDAVLVLSCSSWLPDQGGADKC
jgi:hypothetical protein